MNNRNPKHTHGPLQVRRNEDGYIVVAESHRVAQLGSDSTAKANARLIAAAPEMLEALRVALDTLLECEAEDTVYTVRKAIAKATGGAT